MALNFQDNGPNQRAKRVVDKIVPKYNDVPSFNSAPKPINLSAPQPRSFANTLGQSVGKAAHFLTHPLQVYEQGPVPLAADYIHNVKKSLPGIENFAAGLVGQGDIAPTAYQTNPVNQTPTSAVPAPQTNVATATQPNTAATLANGEQAVGGAVQDALNPHVGSITVDGHTQNFRQSDINRLANVNVVPHQNFTEGAATGGATGNNFSNVLGQLQKAEAPYERIANQPIDTSQLSFGQLAQAVAQRNHAESHIHQLNSLGTVAEEIAGRQNQPLTYNQVRGEALTSALKNPATHETAMQKLFGGNSKGYSLSLVPFGNQTVPYVLNKSTGKSSPLLGANQVSISQLQEISKDSQIPYQEVLQHAINAGKLVVPD